VPGLSWLEVTVSCPDGSAVQKVVEKSIGAFPGAGVYVVCSDSWPPGVAPARVSVNGVVAEPAAGVIDSFGLTACVPVPVSDNVSSLAFALITSVADCAPRADGLNCVVIAQLVAAASWPLIAHVVVHGNSWRFESETPPIATDVVPVFHNVTTTGVLEVVPTTVAGNVVPLQVTVNVDGVTVAGVAVVVVVDVGDVLVAQLTAARRSRNNTSSRGRWAGRKVECKLSTLHLNAVRRRVISP